MSLFNKHKIETQPNQLSAVQAKEAKEEKIRNLRRIIISGSNNSSTNTTTTSNLTTGILTGNVGTVTISNNNNLLQSIGGNGTWTPVQINPYNNQYNNPHVVNTYPVTTANSIKVNEFEQVLNQLFTGEEKKDFITSIGYIVSGEFASKPNQENADVVGTLFEAIDVIFLREISIKFKNMLLAKPVLKIKL